MASFQLRFDRREISSLASQYLQDLRPRERQLEDLIELEIGPRSRTKGSVAKPDFLSLAEWKAHRIVPRCNRNEQAYVEAVTAASFSASDERLRIEVLTLLSGVSWPMASVVLHFCSPDPYPILDFRALWSLTVEPPSAYGFDFWHSYVTVCRELAHASGTSMRVLDRALWQYSKLNQRR